MTSYRALRKIQTMDINIKGIDIDHFHEHVNSLTNALAAHGMIMMHLMHHLLKSYKFFRTLVSGSNSHKLSKKYFAKRPDVGTIWKLPS